MAAKEMLQRWFINDTATASQQWRIKGHAEASFWNWMASWSRMASNPADMGFDGSRFELPELNITRHQTHGDVKPMNGGLFAADVSATNMHDVKRQTIAARAEAAASLVLDNDRPWVVWCDTDYEANALGKAIPGALDVRGSMPIGKKEDALESFSLGQSRVIITKPGIAGYGLNWQHCRDMVFVGRSFSYELWYQAVRRSWRFGQKHPVDVHIIVAEGEDQIGRVIDRKSDDHKRMKTAMREAMRRAVGQSSEVRVPYNPTYEGRLPSWMRSAA